MDSGAADPPAGRAAAAWAAWARSCQRSQRASPALNMPTVEPLSFSGGWTGLSVREDMSSGGGVGGGGRVWKSGARCGQGAPTRGRGAAGPLGRGSARGRLGGAKDPRPPCVYRVLHNKIPSMGAVAQWMLRFTPAARRARPESVCGFAQAGARGAAPGGPQEGGERARGF